MPTTRPLPDPTERFAMPLVVQTVDVGDHALDIVRTEDPYSVVEPFLEPHQRGPDGFCLDIWPAAIALSEWLLGPDGPTGGPTDGPILDLGTGLGVTALAAAAAGHRVVATDGAGLCVELLQWSAELNGLDHKINAHIARWGQPLPKPPGGYTAVIGADLLYEPASHEALLATISATLAPGASAFIADPCRQSADTFPATCTSQGWHCTEQTLTPTVRLFHLHAGTPPHR